MEFILGFFIGSLFACTPPTFSGSLGSVFSAKKQADAQRQLRSAILQDARRRVMALEKGET